MFGVNSNVPQLFKMLLISASPLLGELQLCWESLAWIIGNIWGCSEETQKDKEVCSPQSSSLSGSKNKS